MRAVVFGANGMLGKAMVKVAKDQGWHVTAYGREEWDITSPWKAPPADGYVWDVAFNCAAIIPAREGSQRNMAAVNGIGPHVLAGSLNGRVGLLVQISTDGVFSGDRLHGAYCCQDIPDPITLYDRTKLTGELTDCNFAATIRTSFVGWEHGLLAWLVSQKGIVPGFVNAWWSGSTVDAVARAMVLNVRTGLEPGLYHLAAEVPIRRLDMLNIIRSVMDLSVEIEPTEEPHINHALEPTLWLEPFEPAFCDMAKEWCP
jgi:dTDP-4-dehydrorhamnose reductase